MNIKEFFNKYNGKYVDVDGKYGGQCVDLFRQYYNEVLGIKENARGVFGAKDFWTNYSNDKVLYSNFDKISNTLKFVPQIGDVMIWKNGLYGHIAICTGVGNAVTFQSFDQNYPTGSKCKYVTHNYLNVFGVLRPKNQTNINEEIKPRAKWYARYRTTSPEYVRVDAGIKERVLKTYTKGTVFDICEEKGEWGRSPSRMGIFKIL